MHHHSPRTRQPEKRGVAPRQQFVHNDSAMAPTISTANLTISTANLTISTANLSFQSILLPSRSHVFNATQAT